MVLHGLLPVSKNPRRDTTLRNNPDGRGGNLHCTNSVPRPGRRTTAYPKAYLHSRCLSDGNGVPRPNNLRIPVPRPNWVFLKPQVHDRLHYSQFNCSTFDHTGFRSQQTCQKRYTTMSDRRNFTRTGRLLLLALAFGVSVFALSNLMPLLLQVATKGFTFLDGLLIAGNLFVGTVAVAFLAKAMYRLDKKAGRIRTNAIRKERHRIRNFSSRSGSISLSIS